MNILNFGIDGKYVKITSDEGMLLTTWQDDNDIITFDCCKQASLLSSLLCMYREITEEYATELRNRRDKAMEQLASIDENDENI